MVSCLNAILTPRAPQCNVAMLGFFLFGCFGVVFFVVVVGLFFGFVGVFLVGVFFAFILF